MHRSTKTGLIGIAILVCVLVVILFLNLGSIQPKEDESCLVENSTHCHTEDSNPYRYYSTKTAYNVAVTNTTDAFDLRNENCTAKVFYLFSRHATRYPGKDEIKAMIKTLPFMKERIISASHKGKAHLCKEDVAKLKEWSLSFVPADDKRLSLTGEIEAEELAKRLKARFPSILNQTYSPEKFIFGYTVKDRTRSTAEAFARGLFDNEQYRTIDFDNKTNVEFLMFHKSCKAYQEKCKFSGYDLSEVDKVKSGDLQKAMVERVSKRAGIPLTTDDVQTIYRACTFGYALDIGDVWCSLLSTVDLKVLEFINDVDDYYKDAYGNKINYEQACPVAKFIVDLFRSSKDDSRQVVLHFSHSGAIKKVFAMLGLFKDQLPLTADAFCSQKDRKWRSSSAVPFNANLALVLYQCGSGGGKVAVYHNEKLVRIKGCTDDICSLEEFYTVYGSLAQHCSVEKTCCTCCKN